MSRLPLTMMSACGLEQADQLVAGGHRLAAEHPPLALPDQPFDKRLIVPDLGLPESDGRLARDGKPRRRVPQSGQGRAGDLDQFAVEQRKPRRAGLCAYRRLEASRRATGLGQALRSSPQSVDPPPLGEAGGIVECKARSPACGTERWASSVSTCRRRCC